MSRKIACAITIVVLAMTIEGTLSAYETSRRTSQAFTASPPTEPPAVTRLSASPARRAP